MQACWRAVGLVKPTSGILFKNSIEVFNVAVGLVIAMPLNCAVFPQFSKIYVDKLEKDLQEKIKGKGYKYLIFNKGL
jgi:hypothetical protein